MLDKLKLTDLPPHFARYFGKAADSILTGHFFSATITPASVAPNTTVEQTFTVKGLRVTDLIIVNKPSTTAGIIIGSFRATAVDTLGIEFGNVTAGALTPASETYQIVVVRKEKE